MGNYLVYDNGKFSLQYKEGTFYSFLGDGNLMIVNDLSWINKNNFISYNFDKINSKNINSYRKNISFVLNKHLNLFLGETVKECLQIPLQNLCMDKKDINKRIDSISSKLNLSHLYFSSPKVLCVSDKVKLKIASALISEVKVIVLSNILCELDDSDKKLIYELLREFVQNGGVVINFTNDINDSLFSDEIYICDREKILVSGKTLNVLNEDVLLKKMGYGLPFIVELNRYLIDYNIINKYELDVIKLVGEIWK